MLVTVKKSSYSKLVNVNLVAHACTLIMGETEACGSLWVQRQSPLRSETLSQRNQRKLFSLFLRNHKEKPGQTTDLDYLSCTN